MVMLKNRSSRGQKSFSPEVQQACRSEMSGSSCCQGVLAKEEAIRKKAYELYEQRGCEPGHELEDWLEAKRLVDEKEKY